MPRKQKFPHLIGSKWTACQKIDGWRHFQVKNRKNQDPWVFAEMVSSCDPNIRFWLNAQLLKDRSLWQGGWLSLQEMALETAVRATIAAGVVPERSPETTPLSLD
jgi:tryptophan-rich hypothetical protein